MENGIVIREILMDDSPRLEIVIKTIFEQMDIPKIGTAYEDDLGQIYRNYQQPRSIYYVAIADGTLVGGAGIAPLPKCEGDVCELQKMYVKQQTRGQGIGKKLIAKCLDKALDFKFAGCYLETLPIMKIAQRLYVSNGFEYLDNPMGNTGHSACHMFMFKRL